MSDERASVGWSKQLNHYESLGSVMNCPMLQLSVCDERCNVNHGALTLSAYNKYTAGMVSAEANLLVHAQAQNFVPSLNLVQLEVLLFIT